MDWLLTNWFNWFVFFKRYRIYIQWNPNIMMYQGTGKITSYSLYWWRNHYKWIPDTVQLCNNIGKNNHNYHDYRYSKNVKFHWDLPQTWGNTFTIQKLWFLQRNVWQAGSVHVPTVPGKCKLTVPRNYHTFPCKKTWISDCISISLQYNSTQLHIFAKFGMANLFVEYTYLLSHSILRISGCFKKELFKGVHLHVIVSGPLFGVMCVHSFFQFSSVHTTNSSWDSP